MDGGYSPGVTLASQQGGRAGGVPTPVTLTRCVVRTSLRGVRPPVPTAQPDATDRLRGAGCVQEIPTPMQSALFPGVVLAVIAAVTVARLYARKRAARLKLSGGKMSLALNLMRHRDS
jgi:hypothetical protein